MISCSDKYFLDISLVIMPLVVWSACGTGSSPNNEAALASDVLASRTGSSFLGLPFPFFLELGSSESVDVGFSIMK